MSLEAALVAELNDNVGVAKRIYPLVVPQSNGDQSCIVYTRITTRRYPAFQTDVTMQTPRMQIDCYAMSYSAALTIANAVIARIQNKSGTLGAGANAVTKCAVITPDESHSYEPDTKRYRVRVDFFITHEEA